MSITSSGTRKAGPYNCNGSTTDFPFAFKVFQASDVLVVQTDTTPADNVVASNNYTVVLNANQDSNPGGTVRMNTAPQNGYLLTIGSQVPQIQSVTLTNTGGFYPTVINNALDYLTILIQQLSEKIGRALTMPFSTNASGQLPPVSPGSLLGWKADGTGIANVGATGVGAGGVVASNMAAGATGTALSTDTQAAATKTTPADTDKLPLFDSASFWSLKGLTWANLKAAFLNNGFSTITGSQMQISGDLSPLWEGTQSTLTSGAAYVLNGNILIMKARTHNVKIDTSGNFTGVSKTGIATVEFWGEDDVIRVFTAPSVTAGTVPTFGATPTYTLDMKTGAVASASSPIAGSFKNLQASANGISANISVTADELVLENGADVYQKVSAVSLTINSATSAANGLDTGTLAASTWYAVWAIWNGTTVAGLLSANSTAPTMPTGYTHKARIGWIRTDGTANKYPLSFKQYGRRIQYVVAAGGNVPGGTLMASGTAGNANTPTWAAVGVSSFVPTTASAIIVYCLAGSNGVIGIAPNSSYGAWTSATNPPPILGIGPGTTSASYAGPNGALLLESNSIYWYASVVSQIYCLGWEDNI